MTGGGVFCLLYSLAFFTAGTDMGREISLRILVAVLGTTLVVTPLKLLVRRPRPPEAHPGSYYRTDPHGFPAGHPARAAATTLAVVPLASNAVIGGLVAWTVAVGISRLHLRAHRASDVLAGWAIGTGIGVGLRLLERL